jgi:hypothetical protein
MEIVNDIDWTDFTRLSPKELVHRVILLNITEADVQKAIDFLESISYREYCVQEQTENWNKENIGKSHCALGHLGVNPASPFYDPAMIVNDTGSVVHQLAVVDNKSFPMRLNRLAEYLTGITMVAVNNNAWTRKEAGCKDRVIAHLKDMLSKMQHLQKNTV